MTPRERRKRLKAKRARRPQWKLVHISTWNAPDVHPNTYTRATICGRWAYRRAIMDSPKAFRQLPRTAQCRSCLRAWGIDGCATDEQITAVEVGLIGLSRVFETAQDGGGKGSK